MKKQILAFLINLGFFATSWSQSNPLMVQGETGKLYLLHLVEAGENWYSVGRMYNISPREIAPFNGETLEKPLVIGQQLKMPLTVINFSQDGMKSAGETLVPVYHIAQEKGWLYRISSNYNAVPVENLEKWNHVNRDQVKKGMQLIIGYLKVKASQSSLAKMGGVIDKPESRPVNSSPPETESQPVNSYASNHPMSGGGYFRPDYIAGNGSVSGEAGTFKSISGWQDGKYYALMNNIQVGTIVKVSSSVTHKSIYAKILGQLPEMKESAGLTIRISNAAASELGTEQIKFPVDVKF